MKFLIINIFLFFLFSSCQETPGTFTVDSQFPEVVKNEINSGEKNYFIVAKMLNCKSSEDKECSEKAVEAIESGKLLKNTEELDLSWKDLTYGKNKRLYLELNEFVDGKTVHIYTGNSPLFNFEVGKTSRIKEFYWQNGKRDILLKQPSSFSFNVSLPGFYKENLDSKKTYYFKTVLGKCIEDNCTDIFSTKYKEVNFENLIVDFVGIENPEQIQTLISITTSLKEEDCPELEHSFKLPVEEPTVPLSFSSCKLFRNTELRQCVRVALGKYDNTLPISYDELLSLKKLGCERRYIQKIEGIEVLQNLEVLDLNANRIYTIDELRYLTKLTTLIVGSNHILDFSPLQNLDLSFFSAGLNYNNDVQILQNLKNLKGLVLEANYITDFSFLKDLTKLERLNIKSQSVAEIDIDAIKHLENLKELYISKNRIKDFSPIKELSNLTHLFAEDVVLKDGSFLKDLPKLKYLHLSNNEITDPSFLEDIPNIYYVDMDSNCFDEGNLTKRPKFFYHTGRNPICSATLK